MKRIYIALMMIAALSVASCKPMDEEDAPDAVVTSSGITITTSNITDNSFTFTLTPKEASNYYSYLVDKGDKVKTLDAANLYAAAYSGVDKGCIKYDAASPSTTIKVEKLTENTTYHVYAVAGSVTGVPSEISVATITTTDGNAPSASKFEVVNDSTVTVTYSENLKYVPSSTDAMVKYYAVYSQNFIANSEKMDVPADSVHAKVAVSGNVATFSFTVPDGAYFALDVLDNVFTDVTGNGAAGFTSVVYTNADGDIAGVNCYGRKTVKPWSFEADTSAVRPVTDKYIVAVPEATVAYAAESPVDLVVKRATYSTDYTLTYNVDYAFMQGVAAIFWPDAYKVSGGDKVTATIPADAFMDQWGNGNKVWTAKWLFSYGLKLEDLIGKYHATITSYFASQIGNEAKDWYIAKSDNAKKGNVMFTVYRGTTCATPIYATFDLDLGTLFIPDWQSYGASATRIFYFAVNGDGGVTMDAHTPGEFGNPDMYFGTYLTDLNGANKGWSNLFTSVSCVRFSTDPTIGTASTSSMTSSSEVSFNGFPKR